MISALKLSGMMAAVLLLANSIYGQRQDFQIGDLLGTYTQNGGFAGSSITIEPEGKYHINSGDCTQEYFEAGTYELKGGVFSFLTTKYTVKGHGQPDEEAKDLLDPKVFREKYHEDPPANFRRSELLPVKWAERLYLLSKDSLIEFCNAINLGLEPRHQPGSDWYLGTFYLREGDEKKSATGHPSLDRELLDMLLDKPVEATIKSILRENDLDIAVIDKGSEAGLRPGMHLVINEREFSDGPTLWSGLIVVSAEPHFAKLKVLSAAQIGDKVTSRYLDRRFQ
jgi:hypothetical protein